MSIETVGITLFWSAATVSIYLLAKQLNRRFAGMLTTPLLITPVALIALALALHTGYSEYIRSTHWLVALLGPATVAFAVPIYENRGLIGRYWLVLMFGGAVGSATSIVTAWLLASALTLDDSLRASLLPRSVSSPFAMTISQNVGGVPELTAVFVVVTGLFGASFGGLLLRLLPLKSSLARGALFGMGAHGAGVARAHQIGREEGSVAGLVMVLVGLFNVLAAPLLGMLLR